MVGDRKGSSCIVQDDELNTPERGVEPEFDFTSLLGVMDTSSAVKEGNVAKRDLKLDLATPLGTDKINNTPVILQSLLKQDEPFDLVSYILDGLVPGTTLPTGVEFVAKETRGHPEKWEYPSPSKESISSCSRSQQRKNCQLL
ncbi:uncharacterized protein LOC111874331 isoform X4 [Cryptotermes secundus]|uniref:uncharacterized protein LOC111874331 isoform X3 n=1 Tax=Cryptotermes secundus TaxID=105785 RepID=UPI000CD7B9CA|nr:uncharacterized protein LOC111874331 isoform X3 [Cryptotermes secundus]XP_033611302.1 uncharacterized protein LOC111874331 isoform X4 [Cryptotermes secundus]